MTVNEVIREMIVLLHGEVTRCSARYLSQTKAGNKF
jgi:hypothetical protein